MDEMMGRGAPNGSDGIDARRRELFERFQQLISNPSSPIGEVDEAYLRLEGEQIWLDAIERYQSDGRGAMMVDLRDLESGGVDVFYLPHALVIADLPAREAEQGLGLALKEYDPTREAIIVFWHRHGSTFYRLGEGPGA